VLIIAAAEHVSKTPYYVAGLALTVFALVVSAIGIRGHETFPASKRTAQGVMALAALLMVATMVTAVMTG
jgi:uncharacterized membrane protein YidH (DUF202 family)